MSDMTYSLRNELSSCYSQESQQIDPGSYGSSSDSQPASQHLGTFGFPSVKPHQSQVDNGGSTDTTMNVHVVCVCVCVCVCARTHAPEGQLQAYLSLKAQPELPIEKVVAQAFGNSLGSCHGEPCGPCPRRASATWRKQTPPK